MSSRRQKIRPETKVLLKQIGIGALVFGLLALFITGVWHGTRLPAVTIDEINVYGGETIKHRVIEEIVAAELSGDYLGLIPKRFTWTYPESRIIDSVSAIDRVHSVEVSQTKRALSVSFDEYVPYALWCDGDLSSEKCLFLDETGLAFSKAPVLSGGTYLRFVTSGEQMEVGKLVLPFDIFSMVNELVELLAANDWYVSRVELDNVGDAFLTIVGGGELKVTIANPPEEIVDNLRAILASPEFSHLAPGNFQYIDLRFGSKVYINEEPAVPEIETASSTLG
ncbi:hypothetical protein KC851_02650 [Candidatus Kaiserbacteria bacterium]|nr:hypothetical protein [Candidatus Kaiserbacteria bacterium]